MSLPDAVLAQVLKHGSGHVLGRFARPYRAGLAQDLRRDRFTTQLSARQSRYNIEAKLRAQQLLPARARPLPAAQP